MSNLNRLILCVVFVGTLSSAAFAQNPFPDNSDLSDQTPASDLAIDTNASDAAPADSSVTAAKGIRLGQQQKHVIKVGFKIRAGGPCQGVFATVPVPMEWPEQKVRIIDENVSASVSNFEYRTLDDGVRQLVVQIPRLRQNESAEAIITFELERNVIEGPTDTSIYVIPKKLDRSMKLFLAASPYIESRSGVIRRAVRDVVAEKETAWEQVQAIYDFVREKVTYKESELKGAVDTLRDGEGDCEAMTSLFIALCRAHNVPARMVWVTDHSYPEFYLEDDEGNGHWFPCQVSGSQAFGSMPETRPILQKGDSIRIPEKRKRERYASMYLNIRGLRGASPKIHEVLEYGATENAAP